MKNKIGPTRGTKDRIIHINLSVGDLKFEVKIITTVISHNSGIETGIIRLKINPKRSGSICFAEARISELCAYDKELTNKITSDNILFIIKSAYFTHKGYS